MAYVVLTRILFHELILQILEDLQTLLAVNIATAKTFTQALITLADAVEGRLCRGNVFILAEARIAHNIDLILRIEVTAEGNLIPPFVDMLADIVHQHHVTKTDDDGTAFLQDVEGLTDVIVHHRILLWYGLQALVVDPAVEDILLCGPGHRGLEELGDAVLVLWFVGDHVWQLIRTDLSALDERFEPHVLPEHEDHAVGDERHRQLVGRLVEHELHHDVLIGDIAFQADMVSIGMLLTDRDVLDCLGS